MSVLDRIISYYPSITATQTGVTVSLLQLLESTKHKGIIEELRNEQNMQKQHKIKEALPCYTVSGIFKRRNSSGLISPSGLAAIDLDSAEDFEAIDLMQELKKLPYIAYTGLSCRGQRLFCILPFATDAYEKHYDRLIRSFEDMGLPMGDSCHKQISQPRYVSYNDADTCFYNHKAKAYKLLPDHKTYHFLMHERQLYNSSPGQPFDWCKAQINKKFAFEVGQRHNYVKQLARYCNIKGLPEVDTLNGCLELKTPDFNETEISNIIKYIYIYHANSHNKHPFSVTKKNS